MDLLTHVYNSGQLKAVNYSLMIKGLTVNTTISDIQKYLEDVMEESKAKDRFVVKIYIIYNFKNYLKMQLKRQEISEKNISFVHQI